MRIKKTKTNLNGTQMNTDKHRLGKIKEKMGFLPPRLNFLLSVFICVYLCPISFGVEYE